MKMFLRAVKTFIRTGMGKTNQEIVNKMPLRQVQNMKAIYNNEKGERGGSVVEHRTPGREVGSSKTTSAVFCH